MAGCSLEPVSVASVASNPIFSASVLGQSNFISPQSFPSESSRSSNNKDWKKSSNQAKLPVGQEEATPMKYCAVTLAMEEPVSDHNTPVCKVCHVNLKEFADTFKGMRQKNFFYERHESFDFNLGPSHYCNAELHAYFFYYSSV